MATWNGELTAWGAKNLFFDDDDDDEDDDDDGDDDDDDYVTVLLIKAEHNIDFDVGRDDACRPELGKVAMVVMMVMKDVAMMIMTVVVVGLMMHVARNCCHDGDGGWTDGCADHSNEDDLQCLYNERRTPKLISQGDGD